MTTIKQSLSSQDVKREIKAIHRAARKVMASKSSARKFLASTGMYTANGQLKPQYR